jgi:isopenicillin-N epimerase
MVKHRREFLDTAAKFALTTSAVAIFMPEFIGELTAATQSLGNATPDAVARDEVFWSFVRQSFSIDSRYIALNAGANNISPRATLDALLRNIEVVNAAPLTNQRDFLGPQVEIVRSRLAAMANCSAEEIALTRNTTESLNIVISGLDLKAGDEILATNQEYPSILNALRQRAARDRIGLNVISIPTPPKQIGDLADVIDRAIGARTRVILVSHIVDSTGQIFPVKRIAEIAHSRGIQLIVDGALSFGTIEVDLRDMDCDYYGTSLHKGLHAPLGTGFLYVKRHRIAGLWPLFASATPDSEDIRKFEAIGTHPVYQIAAINEAIDFHETFGAERKRARLHYLKRYWADKLAPISKIRFHTALDPEQSCGVATVEIAGLDPKAIYRHLLEKYRIQAWPIEHQEFRGLWVSPFFYTRPEELERFVDAMSKIAKDGLPA